MNVTPDGLRDVVVDAVVMNDRSGFSLNRIKARTRIIDAVMAAIEPIISSALDEAYDAGVKDGYIKGTHQGQALGRSQALLEAETMLKRHGHRSAVTRVQALADAADAALMAIETPARPQPVNASPAGGPGPSEPQDGIYDYGTRTWHPVPTPPENGAQRGAQGRVEAYAADVQERLTRD